MPLECHFWSGCNAEAWVGGGEGGRLVLGCSLQAVASPLRWDSRQSSPWGFPMEGV